MRTTSVHLCCSHYSYVMFVIYIYESIKETSLPALNNQFFIVFVNILLGTGTDSGPLTISGTAPGCLSSELSSSEKRDSFTIQNLDSGSLD